MNAHCKTPTAATITPAMKTVLAYVHLTGRMPAHIRTRTYIDALDFVTGEYPKKLKDEALELVRDHPFLKGRDYLVSLGFEGKPSVHHRRDKQTSQTLRFLNLDTKAEAYIIRSGGGWIWTPNGRGMDTEKLEGKF